MSMQEIQEKLKQFMTKVVYKHEIDPDLFDFVLKVYEDYTTKVADKETARYLTISYMLHHKPCEDTNEIECKCGRTYSLQYAPKFCPKCGLEVVKWLKEKDVPSAAMN